MTELRPYFFFPRRANKHFRHPRAKIIFRRPAHHIGNAVGRQGNARRLGKAIAGRSVAANRVTEVPDTPAYHGS